MARWWVDNGVAINMDNVVAVKGSGKVFIDHIVAVTVTGAEVYIRPFEEGHWSTRREGVAKYLERMVHFLETTNRGGA